VKTRSKYVLLYLLLGLVALHSTLSQDQSQDPDGSLTELISELRAFIPVEMRKNRIPGLSLALVQDGRVVWTDHFGVTNTITRQPVTPETVFEVASLGKPVAAYGALRLVDQGLLSLDASLHTYLDEPFLPPTLDRDAISLRRVLSHSSGLSNDMVNFDTDLYFKPGLEFRYSGMGYL
jgi:CubicO group peptidase (beta-lactamase class C family)